MQQAGKDNLDYWTYEEDELDMMLEKFWFGARKDPDSEYETDDEDPQKQSLMYSANTMKNFGYSLNRILKSKGHLYDIISPSSLSFRRSQIAFKASEKELKELGKAEIKSKQEISEEGKHCNQIYFFPCEKKSFFHFSMSAPKSRRTKSNVA